MAINESAILKSELRWGLVVGGIVAVILGAILYAAEKATWMAGEAIQALGGNGYTVDTLRALHRRWPRRRWTLVVGSDIVSELPRWHEVEEIRRLARILVLNRAGHPAPGAVGPPLAYVSSSEVRAAIAAGRGGEGLVHRDVLAYIERHRLYRAPGRAGVTARRSRRSGAA